MSKRQSRSTSKLSHTQTHHARTRSAVVGCGQGGSGYETTSTSIWCLINRILFFSYILMGICLTATTSTKPPCNILSKSSKYGVIQ